MIFHCLTRSLHGCANTDTSQRNKPTEPIDDEDGHYIVQPNARLGDRYSISEQLGQGTFGKVVKALDIRTRREVAVKIIRAVPKVFFEKSSFLDTFTNRLVHHSTETPVASSCEYCRPSDQQTSTTATAASSCATASIGEATSVSSHHCSAYLYSIS